MPSVEPEYLDAVDSVIENKDTRAEWDNDEMRSALMEVEKGATLEEASEDRGFTKGTLSDVRQQAEDEADALRQKREEGSGLFRDPVDEAVESFRDFFEELNEKYEMGINNVTVEMMVDEVRDAQQLPRANYVASFLDQSSSGVSNQGDIRYITRRYRQWLENFKESQGSSMGGGGAGGIGGTDVSGGGGIPQGSGGGHDVSGRRSMFPGEDDSQEQQSNDRVDRLERKFDELKSLIQQDEQQDSAEGQITIEKEDGTKVTAPANHPAIQQMTADDGGDDSPGFMEMLQQAKEAGLVVGPEEMRQMEDSGSDFEDMLEKLQTLGVVDTGGGDEMAQAIESAISDLGQKQLQAQQEMSQNFTQVMESMRDMQEDEDDDLTAEDVQAIVEDELTKDETERLREEMDEKFEQVMETVEDRRRRQNAGKQDTEYLKTDRQMQFKEKQLETLNDNLQTLPKAVAQSVREGLVPAMKEMQHMDGGGGSPLWSPPEQGVRGEPGYVPEEVERRNRQAQQQPAPAEQESRPPERDATAPRQPESDGYPDPESGDDREVEDEQTQMAQEEPEGVTAADAEDIREKLNLEDDDDPQEVPQ